jgi:DNA-binding IscR family transcriptional regulator
MSAEKILYTLKKTGKPMKSAEIAESSGIDKKEVDKVLKSLKAEGKISSPKVCYYQAS